MPRDTNNLGKNDPLSRTGNGARRVTDSDSEDEDRQRERARPSTTGSPPGAMSLPELLFLPATPPPPAAERLGGPLMLSQVHSILRDVLQMLEDDDFSDLDGSAASASAPPSSSGGTGGGGRPRGPGGSSGGPRSNLLPRDDRSASAEFRSQ